MNLSSPHFEAHKNYIRGIDEATCRFMSELREDKDICAFVTHTPSCHEAENMVDYLHLVFCTMGQVVEISFTSACLMLLCIAAVLVLSLCTLALNSISNFLSIVKHFHMNEHNAGATLLVLFNGIPDIISAFFFYDGDTELLINEMLGTSLYLRAFHSGIIILLLPTALCGTYFMRDAWAYLFGIIVFNSIASERNTNVFEGVFAMVFYPALCFVVFVHHRAAQEERKKTDHKDVSEEMKIHLELIKEIEIIQLPMTSDANPLDVGIFKQFCMVMSPFRKEVFDNANTWQKILVFFAIPVKLVVPGVNIMMPGAGWSRLLLFLNFLLSPLIMLQFFGFAYILICLGCGLILATIVFCSTTTKTPKYQFPIALYGIGCEMLITRFLASELLSILVTVGNIFGIKRSVIGTTFLAWGNTIPEIVVYCTLIQWKIKTMPLIGFLMAPLLNIVFAIGLTTVLRSIDKRSFYVITRSGDLGRSGIVFDIVHHVLFTFAVLTTNFQLRRSIGVFSMFVYLIFVLYTYLYQFDFIHAYGSDHNDEEKFIAATWA